MSDLFNLLVNKNVLIVDDDQILRELMVKEMIYHGMSCLGAANSIEAIALLAKNTIDILISDINMPEGNAYDLLDKLKKLKLPNSPKIILISGYSELSQLELHRLGVSDFISKPFRLNDLLELMVKN